MYYFISVLYSLSKSITWLKHGSLWNINSQMEALPISDTGIHIGYVLPTPFWCTLWFIPFRMYGCAPELYQVLLWDKELIFNWFGLQFNLIAWCFILIVFFVSNQIMILTVTCINRFLYWDFHISSLYE